MGPPAKAMTHPEAVDLVNHLLAAWNEGCAEVFASLFTERAVYVPAAGQVRRGRSAIAELLAPPGRGTVRLDGDVTVMSEGSARVVLFAWSGDSDEGQRRGLIACTVVRHGSGWLIEGLQNSSLEGSSVRGRPATARSAT